VRVDAGQSGDLVVPPDSGGSKVALRSQGMSGGVRTEVSSVGQSDCLASVGLEYVEDSRDTRAVLSPARVYPEQNQSVSQIVDERAVSSQVQTDMHLAVVEVSDRAPWLLGSCSGSVGGRNPAWRGNVSVDPTVSGWSGLGMQLNHFQHLQSLQARIVVENSTSQPSGGLELVVFQEGEQHIEKVGSGKVVCESAAMVGEEGLDNSAEMEEEAGIDRVSPLNTYSLNSGDFSGYSDWVTQCANQIYPIVGISHEDQKLLLLALLTHLEEERRSEALGALSSGGSKGKREVKNLECTINYDIRGSCSRRGRSRARGHPVMS
jgi:hypothetical protein